MARRLENRFPNISVADMASIARALEALELSGSAAMVSQFERGMAEKFGRSFAVALCSGTVSIYSALWALKIGPGDEVIVPPTAPIMSALPIVHLGATPVFADVTSTPGFGLDPDALEAAISNRTRAVICVPLWGYPIDMDVIAAIAKNRNIALIEDVAQSHGTTWHGRYLGTFGDAGCLSTHERKLITTGEGGVVLTDREDLANGIRILVRYGIFNNVGGEKLGSNYKLAAVPAALGLSQITKLDMKIHERKRVGDAIRAGLSQLSWLREFPIEPDSVHNGYSLVYEITDRSIDGALLGQKLAAEGVISDTWRYNYRPMYRYPLFVPYASACPNAEDLIPRTLTLPCHEGLSDEDIDFLVTRVSNAVQ